jgi:hypothetical protein
LKSRLRQLRNRTQTPCKPLPFSRRKKGFAGESWKGNLPCGAGVNTRIFSPRFPGSPPWSPLSSGAPDRNIRASLPYTDALWRREPPSSRRDPRRSRPSRPPGVRHWRADRPGSFRGSKRRRCDGGSRGEDRPRRRDGSSVPAISGGSPDHVESHAQRILDVGNLLAGVTSKKYVLYPASWPPLLVFWRKYPAVCRHFPVRTGNSRRARDRRWPRSAAASRSQCRSTGTGTPGSGRSGSTGTGCRPSPAR